MTEELVGFEGSQDLEGFFSRGGRSSGRLGKRLVINILLANAFLSIFTASFQLYASYKQGRSEVAEKVRIIDDSLRAGFEEALWRYDFPLIEALLEGIIYDQAVRHVVLEADDGTRWALGDPASVDDEVSDMIAFARDTENGQRVQLGQLYVGLSLQGVRARLWSQFQALVLSNLGKTFAASVVMLLLFDRMVTQHLQTITSHVSQRGWLDSREPLRLTRNTSDAADDMDQIVEAINAAQKKGRADFEALEREIQRRRIVETMLRQRTEALRNANQEQAQFTYAISHDMKSPANTIHMLLNELSHSEANHLSPDGQSILRDARSTADRMMLLVEDVLLYSRIVSDQMPVETVALNGLLKDVLAELQDNIDACNAVVSVSDLPSVNGNAGQLHLLFANLIKNSLKFSKADEPAKISVSSPACHRPGHVVLRVADNGIGIPMVHQEKVFALFQRLHTHAAYPGSGTGLTVCKRIVANHGGQISLDSDNQMGCAVDVQLPREGL